MLIPENFIMPFLLSVGITGLLVGLIIAFRPSLLANLSKRLNSRVIDLNNAQKALEKTREMDGLIVGYSRLIGVVFLVMAVIIFILAMRVNVSFPTTIAILISAFGLIFVFKPSTLANISTSLNKNVIPPSLEDSLDKEMDFDSWVVKNSKLIGAIIVVLSIIVLVLAALL
ncbi:MAG: hypothetical protein COV72_07815 [Candidatus Omnitrophica bacterium CG11_big_fil_rev_8_21_14_0_20_42_13]|uniref:Uncharacterized protein n=1 Tax=Candidatus Ghiorseimicrobium undicola TaxID=1974746 RepID=A0A2H0LVY9_9BACT|nr:MAG: hypothetical protein COV72_07815 [Candidatus Omnitrophica bacterium CG11_big_fil_rev_8_21_14_0_20_42_13]